MGFDIQSNFGREYAMHSNGMEMRVNRITPSKTNKVLLESAPVALFLYNRPKHTLRTLEALEMNKIADQTHLYIFCDGPRAEGDNYRHIEEVREIAASKKWCRKVSTVYHERNLGLADSIRGGIDHVLAEHDKIIVLEDDIVTSPGFLTYMNDALSIYANESQVMNISGYLPETNFRWMLPSTFFHPMMSCWGWGTWRRAWKDGEWEASSLLKQVEYYPGGLNAFDMDGTYPYSDHLRKNLEGALKTWAIFWAASCYVLGGLCLYPRRSLVENIGFDGSGTNCDSVEPALQSMLAKEIKVRKIKIKPSSLGKQYLQWANKFGSNAPIVKRALSISFWLKASING